MSLQIPADVEASVRALVDSGQFSDEGEALRTVVAVFNRYQEDCAAIQEGIDDMQAGRCRPWDEVKAELNVEFGFGDT